jgi:hypothetical protein
MFRQTMARVARAAGLIALLAGCADDAPPPPPAPPVVARGRATVTTTSGDGSRVGAARFFTDHYAHSRMAKWKLRAAASGPNCGVLFVQLGVIADDSMIDALHFGSGPYDVYDGGVDRFHREKTFRGVVYKDSTAHTWIYGVVSKDEVPSLLPCR